MEFRLDYLSQPVAALPKLKHFLDMHPEAMVVATCRGRSNGGKFKGSVAAQVDVAHQGRQMPASSWSTSSSRVRRP